MQEVFRNRELSWLDFNERVLAMAREEGLPLLERLKFLAIYSSNLDEFFQVRVAAVLDQSAAGVVKGGVDGISPRELLEMLRSRIVAATAARDDLLDDLLGHLAVAGHRLCRWSELDDLERKNLEEHFERRVLPLLTPLAVDVSHPFPYISNLALSIGAFVIDPVTGERKFARVKMPPSVDRVIDLGAGRSVLLDDVVVARLQSVFQGMVVENAAVFRVTRSTDLTLEDEDAEDLLAAVETELRRRRFGRAVRLEIGSEMTTEMRDLLVEELEIEQSDVYEQRAPVDLTCLWQLHRMRVPALKDEPWKAVTAGRLAVADESGESIFSVIRKRDLMVHHPYESFATSVEEFVAQAAADPRVLGIKATLYRTSADSPIARSLIDAAERGAQVVALIELKARFDEHTNVRWARKLERAGVHVVYGVAGLKTHAKCILVVRDEVDGLRRYAHIGTGNYNPTTARTYEDMGVFTCDSDVTEDVSQLFNHLTGFSRALEYRRLVVAPRQLRETMKALIAAETRKGGHGRISIKCNAIADPEIVELLTDAVRAGTSVDLLVRGICCLDSSALAAPNLRIRSILGRYLEHSRVYRFGGRDESDALYLLGSADLMPRNLDLRVEVLLPVVHKKHRAWIDKVLDIMWADDVVAFDQDAQGGWRRVGPSPWSPEVDAQGRIMRWASGIQLRDAQAAEFDVRETLTDDDIQPLATVTRWVSDHLATGDDGNSNSSGNC